MLTSSLSTTALLSLALAIAGVEAGSRAWESSVKYARTAEMEAIHARDLAFQAHGNGTTLSGRGISRATTRDAPPSSQHDKRWIGIKPDGATLRLWPQGNIKVCFEQQTWPSGSTTEDILRPSLASARGLWRDRNLDDRDGWFQFEFVADAAWCNDRANRPDYLLVMYAGPNVQNMATTPGMGPKLDTANTRPIEDLGPKMMLSDVLTMGHKNVVANFAHEMGHAWGLHHEHQNPKWWDETYSGESRSKYFFGTESFFCERLSDYQDAVARVNAETQLPDYEKAGRIKKLCTNREMASNYNFAGGFNWLPVLSGSQWDPTKTEPDYESLMIYPSTAGNGNSGDDKAHAIMLQKPNGDVIIPVSKPSLLDVQGLKTMYNKPIKNKLKLLNSKSSQFFNKFKSVRGEDPDTGCN